MTKGTPSRTNQNARIWDRPRLEMKVDKVYWEKVDGRHNHKIGPHCQGRLWHEGWYRGPTLLGTAAAKQQRSPSLEISSLLGPFHQVRLAPAGFLCAPQGGGAQTMSGITQAAYKLLVSQLPRQLADFYFPPWLSKRHQNASWHPGPGFKIF
jgi:hypothetical protein